MWRHIEDSRLNYWSTMLPRAGDLPEVGTPLGAEFVEKTVHFVEPPNIQRDPNANGYVVTATLDAHWTTPSTPA